MDFELEESWPPQNDADVSLQDYFMPGNLSWLDSMVPTVSNPPLSCVSTSTSTGENLPSGTDQSSCPLLQDPSFSSALQVGATRWNFMQQEARKYGDFALPDPAVLCRFIHRYFKTFHQHQPFIHEPSWSAETAEVHLVLAVCANGAVYSLERDTASELHRLALAMLNPDDYSLQALQTMMLLTAFSAWSADSSNLRTAFQIHGRLAIALRHQWNRAGSTTSDGTWDSWVQKESLKR